MKTVDWSRIRYAAVPALALVLSLLAFETVRYSAHHLGHLNRPNQCAVASASAHLTGVAVKSVAIEPPTELLEILPGVRFTTPSIVRLSPTTGRAPPVFII